MTCEDLKKIRQRMGLNQKTISGLLGMRQQNYSRIETGYEGRRPTIQQNFHIESILFIYDNNLLPEYLKQRIRDGK